MKAFITWLHALLFPSFVKEATFLKDRAALAEAAWRIRADRIQALEDHPIMAFLKKPKTWETTPPLSEVEISQVKAFFASSACEKLDRMIHNIALQDMQRAWQPAVASREFEIGAAQGRISAWATIKQLPETLRPQSEHTEAGEGNTPNLDHLVP